jgi:hypothetical protein
MVGVKITFSSQISNSKHYKGTPALISTVFLVPILPPASTLELMNSVSAYDENEDGDDDDSDDQSYFVAEFGSQDQEEIDSYMEPGGAAGIAAPNITAPVAAMPAIAGNEETGNGGNDSDDSSYNNEAVMETYALAKGCVDLQPRQSRNMNCQSACWKYYSVGVIRRNMSAELAKFDHASRLIFDSIKTGQVCICNMCFNDPKLSLLQSITRTQKFHAGNLNRHLKGKHHIVLPGKAEAKKRRTGNHGSAYGGFSYATSSVAAAKNPPIQDLFPKKNSPDSTITQGGHFAENYEIGQKDVMTEFNDLAFLFANNSNMSVRSITSPQCPDYRNFINFILKNAATINKLPLARRFMGERKYTDIRRSKYEQLMGGTSRYCSDIRDYWMAVLKKEVPFITVGHDHWDSKNVDKLGVTVFMYHPKRKEPLKIAVGLEYCDDKKSEPTADATLNVLSKAGITKPDLFRAVNDTTNSALMVGRLLTGTNGTCVMHETELIMEHALGMKVRTDNHVVVDSFTDCEDLRKSAKDAVSFLMDKKAKSRFPKYVRAMAGQGRKALRIPLPNATRVAGTHKMIQGMVTSRWNLREYWQECPARKMISDAEFNQLAELEATLFPLARLSKEVQSNQFGANSYCFIKTFTVYVNYCCNAIWYVADVEVEHNRDVLTRWHAGAKWAPRDLAGKPLINQQAGMTVVSFRKRKKDELTAMTQKLINRTGEEFTRYSAKVNQTQLLSMACNPLSATLGMVELDIYGGILESATSSKLTSEDHIPFQLNYREMAQNELVAQMKDICCNILPKHGEEITGATVVVLYRV